MRWLTERWPILVGAFVVFILIALIYITADGRQELSPWEKTIKSGVAPIYGALSNITAWANHWVAVVHNYSHLEQENTDLRQEVEWLKRRLEAVERLEQENRSLREALGFPFPGNEQPVAAKIIARSPSNWFDKVSINRGEDADLDTGDAVVTPAGVVGRVYSVASNTAEVMLVTDDRSAFGAVVARTGDPVIVEGSGRWSELHLKPLVKEVDLRTGDQIITSAMSGIFPEGLPVGTVAAVDTGQYGLSLSAIIVPHADLARISQVFVIK